MKKAILLIFVCFLFLSSCQNLSEGVTTESEPLTLFPSVSTETEPQTREPYPETETETKTEENAETKEDPPTPSGHSHTWVTLSVRDATCTTPGSEEQGCDCGAKRSVETGLLNHAFSQPTCLTPATCYSCGATGANALGHIPVKGRCTRCQNAITSPLFVLGKELRFDASGDEILHRLGTPTEIVTEGIFTSYIYAEDLLRLTVIQTDADGLWGVFTMDPSAQFYLENQTLTIANMTGEPDLNSQAVYRDLATCRIFAFRDQIGSGENYAMWLRYEEREYDYMNDPNLYGNYHGQQRLSFYYINSLRARHALAPLLWSDACSQVATEYSAYMIESGFFGHDNSYLTRLKQKGIQYQNAGENLSQGYFNAFFVSDAYYNSQSHRANVLDAVFRYVGVGYVKRGGDAIAVFGAQIFYS